MKRLFSGIMLTLLLTSLLTLAFDIQLVRSDYVWTETIYVMADGSIQPATAPISSVDNVTYTLTDNIAGNVSRAFSAIVIQRDNIILDGAGYTLQGGYTLQDTNPPDSIGIDLTGRSNVTVKNMQITAFLYGILLGYSSSNNSISGNSMTNNGGGIFLYSSSNNSVSGNNIASNWVGIWLRESSNYSSVSGNNITANNWMGIRLEDFSSNNSVSGNNITANNYYGIWLMDCSNNSVSGNSFVDDGLVVWFGYYGNVVTDNLVNGKPLVYLEEVSDYAVEDAGQVILVKCNNITVENFNLSHTAMGVQLFETNNTTISGNDITANNNEGIVFYSSSNNSVSGNKIAANNGGGVTLYSSSNNSISGNNITANSTYGIHLEVMSSNNTIWHNNFINNTSQAYSSESTNVWDDGYPSGGNYWSDYNGTDLYRGSNENETSSDGIGDAPYTVDSNNRDNYPLMKPYPWNPHDIGVTYVGTVLEIYFPIIILIFPPQTVIGLGFMWNISVFVMNYGAYPEVFNVTVYGNTEAIDTITNVALASRESIILNVTWDTIGFPRGGYIINAYATPVPGETDIMDNNLTIGWVTVTIPGDVTGDFMIDMADISMIIEWFMRTPHARYWNPNCDVNGDLSIDMADISIAIDHFMQP